MVRRWFPGRGRNTNGKKRFNIRFFRYEALRIATDNFSVVLGHGGWGSVFKGVLPEDGRTVAIKIHNKPYDGFLEMVELISHLRHVNLIQMIGCCVENSQQLLVYEFGEKGSVSDHLHGDKWPAFNWDTRAAICIGTARGLSYIHDEISPRIIHCDIKPANIILGADFVPKISDFDLIDFVGKGEKGAVKGSTVKGTPGYLDPNYILTGQLTEKVDVYSFGLSMLEIISGRRAVVLASRETEDRMILAWAMRVRKEGTVLKIVDPKLTDFPKEDVERFINVAFLCTRATPEQRPSMFQVVHMLYGGHKSDQEISEKADMAMADQPAQWMNSFHTAAVSMSSLTIGGIRDGSSSIGLIDCAAEMESREERDATCSSSKVEEQRNREDIARMYFERSMEKIMKFHTALPKASNRTIQRTTNNKSTEHMFMEAVYPPFLSGEYRTSRIRYSERAAQL